MAHTLVKLGMATALLATAACAGKKTDLPPPPPTTTGTGADTGGDVVPTQPNYGGDVGNTTLPGSRADLINAAGSDTVLFGTDSYEVDDTARSTLDRQATWLVTNSGKTITLEGHADERGTREYNLALGERRANAAKNYLVSRGVAASRITTISYGKERPVALGSDEGAWAQNRRAVTVLVN